MHNETFRPSPQFSEKTVPEQIVVHVTLRCARRNDCRRIWEWRNEATARLASFKTGAIPYHEHKGWFAEKLIDPCVRFLVAIDNRGCEVGYVRFDITGKQAKISVTIDKSERGKGLGTAAIRAGADYLLRTESIECIIAHVKSDNPASKTIFERAGFSLMGSKRLDGVDAWELIYEAMARAPRGSVQGHRLSGEAP